MITSTDQKRKENLFILIIALLFILFVFYGCSGGGGGVDIDGTPVSLTGEDDPETIILSWHSLKVKQLEFTGLLSPNMEVVKDSEGNVHVAYFEGSGNSDGTYDVHYFTLDPENITPVNDTDEEIIVNVDNYRSLSLAIDPFDYPIVSYRGGTVRECGAEQQSDVMFSLRENAMWNEFTGAIGYVERNPVFTDGLAGTNVSSAFDSNGDLHISYQFLYEGCDSMNFQYPDIYYVKKSRTFLDDPMTTEEQVEGNQYGDLNIQNNVGNHNTIVIDSDDNPIIFYYAELAGGTKGLRVARRQSDGTWLQEWIETGCEVGGISAGMNTQGTLGVAYYVTKYTDTRDDVHLLKYAEEGSPWTVQTVDDTTWCGKYPSLAFDPSGHPAIAYYELATYSGYQLKDLKIARFNGNTWGGKEVVAWMGDIGLYNGLGFDDHGEPVIFTFSNTEKAIYLFYRR